MSRDIARRRLSLTHLHDSTTAAAAAAGDVNDTSQRNAQLQTAEIVLDLLT